MADPVPGLAAVDAFAGLSPAELAELAARLRVRRLVRGAVLVHEGEHSTSLYLVASGRFVVELAGRERPVAEIGAGRPIGEIAFFAGGTRSATVRAARDSLVLELTRAEFDSLCALHPGIAGAIAASLARRLRRATANLPAGGTSSPVTVCIVAAAGEPLPPGFTGAVAVALQRHLRVGVLDRDVVGQRLPAADALDSAAATAWCNEFEAGHDLTLYIADRELSPWSRKAVRQADEILVVGRHGSPAAAPLSPVERFARDLHPASSHRLALLHPAPGTIHGTARWLEHRPAHLHHHLVEGDAAGLRRLARFLAGRAVGLVAGGGGALCAAHIGLYQALVESGIELDVLGGTSGGAAITGVLALGATPAEVSDKVEEMFVRSRALRRLTWPRYGLLDHTEFDRQLRRHFTALPIEDLWIPYFAVATNLSRQRLQVCRHGPLWEAVRASSSLPGVLPPVYDAAGDTLVDGGLLDNVPVRAMHELKCGPNLVVALQSPDGLPAAVDYAAIPSRRQLLWRLLTGRGRSLPAAPGPATVLIQSLAVRRPNLDAVLAAGDVLVEPPIPPGATMMDWRRHRELSAAAHLHGLQVAAELRADLSRS